MNQLKVRVGNNGIRQCHALSLSRRYTLPFLLTFFGHRMILLAILYSMQHTNALTMSSLYCFSLGLNFAC